MNFPLFSANMSAAAGHYAPGPLLLHDILGDISFQGLKGFW